MELLEHLGETLCSAQPQWADLQRAASTVARNANGRERVLASIVMRLCMASQEGTTADIVALIRQLTRTAGGLRLSQVLWSEIRECAETCGLVGFPEGNSILLNAQAWNPHWLEDARDIDALHERRHESPSLGDGMLNALRPSWVNYRSEAQKAAVDAWVFAPPGSTTLVTLPTGGGKSMCTILPAWFDSRGGRVSNGTTLVVVPTVALAFDQQKQASTFFRGSAQPDCRTGVNTVRERMDIEAKLRDGSVPILYSSPETLLGSRLYQACLEAAHDGLITRFVIDEAHLVETWGAGFRPEFQLLAAFRRQLLERSGGKLRTLLLSATVSGRSRDVLEQLFSEPGGLISIQANRLRPEIGYWTSWSANLGAREQRVTEALRFLPRPLILYVTRPIEAKKWVERLHADGYRRVAAFTGKTVGDERQALLEAWMSNRIDIMVGTSAFGLGVDKSDVRAIVHATLPENIDRFYQEVGRGGRDGYSASSLLCICPEDINLAYSLNPKRITFERAEPRWRAMLSAPNNGTTQGNTRLVFRDAVPAGKYRDVVEIDRDWNDHLLLLLQRAGVIEIERLAPLPDGSYRPDSWLLVRIIDPGLLEDPERFRNVLDHARQAELNSNPTQQLLDMVKSYAHGEADICFGRQLAEIYDDVQVACGGCSCCRRERREPYGGEILDYQVQYPTSLAARVDAAAPIAPELRSKMGAWKSLIVTWAGPRSPESLIEVVNCLPAFAQLGIQQFVIPEEVFGNVEAGRNLVRGLAAQDKEYTVRPHRMVPTSWLFDRNRPPLLPLPTVILYPPADDVAGSVYQALQVATTNGIVLPACVHIVHAALRLQKVGKAFREHVNGLSETLDDLHTLLENAARSQD